MSQSNYILLASVDKSQFGCVKGLMFNIQQCVKYVMNLELISYLKDNQSFFEICLFCIILLSAIHFFVSQFHPHPDALIFTLSNLFSAILCILIFLSALPKGIIITTITFLGIVLIYGSIVLPSFQIHTTGNIYYKAAYGYLSEGLLFQNSHGFFLLGSSMIIFSLIIAYKPSILYTKNRPNDIGGTLLEYPIWTDEIQIMGKISERDIKLELLMTEIDVYLEWRYEFILVLIYESLYLVRPNSYVPMSSRIMRDMNSSKMQGVSKYSFYTK